MAHLVIGVVLYRGLLYRDSTLHLYSNQVQGTKWKFALILTLVWDIVILEWQQQVRFQFDLLYIKLKHIVENKNIVLM